jgi:hypothetical protein
VSRVRESDREFGLWSALAREHWESVWTPLVDFHVHLFGHHRRIPDRLFEPGPSGVRLDSGRAHVLWGLYGRWVSSPASVCPVGFAYQKELRCFYRFVDSLVSYLYLTLRGITVPDSYGLPTGVQ